MGCTSSKALDATAPATLEQPISDVVTDKKELVTEKTVENLEQQTRDLTNDTEDVTKKSNQILTTEENKFETVVNYTSADANDALYTVGSTAVEVDAASETHSLLRSTSELAEFVGDGGSMDEIIDTTASAAEKMEAQMIKTDELTVKDAQREAAEAVVATTTGTLNDINAKTGDAATTIETTTIGAAEAINSSSEVDSEPILTQQVVAVVSDESLKQTDSETVLNAQIIAENAVNFANTVTPTKQTLVRADFEVDEMISNVGSTVAEASVTDRHLLDVHEAAAETEAQGAIQAASAPSIIELVVDDTASESIIAMNDLKNVGAASAVAEPMEATMAVTSNVEAPLGYTALDAADATASAITINISDINNNNNDGNENNSIVTNTSSTTANATAATVVVHSVDAIGNSDSLSSWIAVEAGSEKFNNTQDTASEVEVQSTSATCDAISVINGIMAEADDAKNCDNENRTQRSHSQASDASSNSKDSNDSHSSNSSKHQDSVEHSNRNSEVNDSTDVTSTARLLLTESTVGLLKTNMAQTLTAMLHDNAPASVEPMDEQEIDDESAPGRSADSGHSDLNQTNEKQVAVAAVEEPAAAATTTVDSVITKGHAATGNADDVDVVATAHATTTTTTAAAAAAAKDLKSDISATATSEPTNVRVETDSATNLPSVSEVSISKTTEVLPPNDIVAMSAAVEEPVVIVKHPLEVTATEAPETTESTTAAAAATIGASASTDTTPTPAEEITTPPPEPTPTAAQLAAEPALKKGFILKQGHIVKNWKSRFFVLQRGIFTYYESETSEPPYGANRKGVVSLLNMTVMVNDKFVKIAPSPTPLGVTEEPYSPTMVSPSPTNASTGVEGTEGTLTTSSPSGDDELLRESVFKDGIGGGKIIRRMSSKSAVFFGSNGNKRRSRKFSFFGGGSGSQDTADTADAVDLMQPKIELLLDIPNPMQRQEWVEALNAHIRFLNNARLSVVSPRSSFLSPGSVTASVDEGNQSPMPAMSPESYATPNKQNTTSNTSINTSVNQSGSSSTGNTPTGSTGKRMSKSGMHPDVEAMAARAAQSGPPKVKKGYILKQGQVVKSWKNRYFILYGGQLTYFEFSSSVPPYGVNKKGEVSLDSMQINVSKSIVHLTSNGVKDRDLYLDIRDSQEREGWVAALKEHIGYYSTSGHAKPDEQNDNRGVNPTYSGGAGSNYFQAVTLTPSVGKFSI